MVSPFETVTATTFLNHFTLLNLIVCKAHIPVSIDGNVFITIIFPLYSSNLKSDKSFYSRKFGKISLYFNLSLYCYCCTFKTNSSFPCIITSINLLKIFFKNTIPYDNIFQIRVQSFSSILIVFM